MFARRRTVILLLSMIIVSLISVFLILFKGTDIVYAETDNKFSGGNGKAETPYQISTADDFCALEELNTQHTLNGYFNVYFVLTSDIDLSGRTINPIGTQLYPFKGHLDGNGFSVTNISINSTEDYAGLFGAISSDASLKDITISGEISGNSNVGGLVGLNQGTVTAISQKGSICGFISNSAVVDSCFSSSDRFNGKLTFRGDDYPNSAIIRDVDLANGDTLTNEKKAAALADGRGAGVWGKREFDSAFCYYPELSVFLYASDSAISDFSKDSTKVSRQTTEVTLGTLSYVYNGKANEPDVYRGEELLLRDVDYTVTFSDNIHVGEKDAACAQITFINYFKGNATKYFSVTKQPITVKWREEKIYYTGQVQHPTVTVESGKKGEDNITFEYLYDSNIEKGKHSVKMTLQKYRGGLE